MSKQYGRGTKLMPFTSSTDADQAYKLSHAPQFKNAEQYIKAKLHMLRKDFCIKVTETEIEHLNEIARESEMKHWDIRKTEEAINRAVRQIINNNWK